MHYVEYCVMKSAIALHDTSLSIHSFEAKDRAHDVAEEMIYGLGPVTWRPGNDIEDELEIRLALVRAAYQGYRARDSEVGCWGFIHGYAVRH